MSIPLPGIDRHEEGPFEPIDVDNRDDLAKTANFLTPETVRIAPAVVPLVMLEGYMLGGLGNSFGFFEKFQSIKRVFFDLAEFFLPQLSRPI
jgi:hypothetical protein